MPPEVTKVVYLPVILAALGRPSDRLFMLLGDELLHAVPIAVVDGLARLTAS